MRYEIKSIRLWSFLRVAFFLNILVGFLAGFLMAFFTAFFISALGSMGEMSPYGFNMPAEFPVGVLFIIYPMIGAIFCAVFLTIFELIVVGFYNLIAKITGGLELILNSVADDTAPQQPIYSQTQLPKTVPPPPPPPLFAAPLPPSSLYEAPKAPPSYFQPHQALGKMPERDEKPPDPEFPSRTVGG